jgi:sulfate-transporting ATPase
VLTDILRFALIGAASGGLYAVLALGIVVVFRSSKVVNFSHAAIGVAAAYVFDDVRGSLPLAVALGIGIGFGVVLGWAVDRLVMRPLSLASPLTRAIAAIGVLITVQSLLNLYYGSDPRIVAAFLPTDPVDIGGISLGLDRLLMLVLSLCLTGGLFAWYKFSRFGIATSAVAENRRSLAALGRSPNTVSMINWAVGGGLAAIGGILLSPITGLTPALAVTLLLPALAAAVLGNMASFPLTLLGGLAIGITQAEVSRFASVQGLQDAVPFIGIMLVLALRGTSLPGRGESAERLPSVGSGRIPWFLLVPAVVLAVVCSQWLFSDDWVAAFTTSVIAAIMLMSLVVVTGYTGQLSLASFALAGIGALVAGLLVADAGWSFLGGAAGGVITAAALGLVVGLPAVRTRGTSLAIVTLGLAVAVQSMILNNSTLSNGIDGISVGFITIFGIEMDALFYPRRYALLALGALVILGLAVLNLRRSTTGRRMIAVRTNERAAAALGIGVPAVKLLAFVLSGAIAAVGGILLAFTNSVVVVGNPGSPFDPFKSLFAVAEATIGGIGFVSGSLLGTVAHEGGVGDRALNQLGLGDWLPVIGGLLLLITVITAPDGVAANMRRQWQLLARRWSRRRSTREAGRVTAGEVSVARAEPASLVVHDLTVSFGATPVLDQVNLELTAGTVLGVIGPNGAGKTTLVDAITGYNRPQSGSILLDGRELIRLSPAKRARRGISRSFQSLELFEDLSVYDNLLVAAERPAWYSPLRSLVAPGRPHLNDAARAAVIDLELEAHLDVSPADLAYGDRRLLAIARALASQPRVLLLDEPAAGLGDHERTELRSVIRQLAERWGVAVLVIEHDVDLVMDVSDHVLALDFGRVIASGPPEAVRRDPAVIAAYLGGGPDDSPPATTGTSDESRREVGSR